ncbi:PAS domain S-box protein, partial [Desulfobacterales bacterium HSG17]|nr:PAS domain S-box protein [Desulfobacterales bacterium HSG17]
FSFNQYKKKWLIQEIDRHSEVIKEDIWATNFTGPSGYLTLVAEREDYAKIELKDMSNESLLTIEGPKLSRLDNILNIARMLPQTIIISEVKYDGQVIGTLVAHHRNMSFYIHFYVFLLFTLIYAIIIQFRKIVQVKMGLEGNVKERTAELYHANKQLSQNIKILNQAQKISHLGHFDYDVTNQILICSDEVDRIFEQDLITNTPTYKKYYKKFHPEDRSIAEKEYLNSIEKKNKFDFEARILLNDGGIKYIQIMGQTEYDHAGNPIRTIGMILDITERKNAEMEIKSSDSKHNKMLANIGDVIVIIDKDGINRYKSPNVEKLFGWKPEDLVGKSTWKNIHPDDIESTQNFFIKLMDEPGAVGTTECRYRSKDDGYKWIEFTGINLFNDLNILGILGNYHDITERKQAEQSLLDSETRFKALHDASFGGIIIHDKGLILECNEGLSAMMGYSESELIGMNGLLLIAEKSRKKVLDNIESGYELPYEATGLRKNGEEFPMRLEARNIPYKQKMVRTVEFRDISEQKRNEDEQEQLRMKLIQVQKMESIGILAGGIAHDFNNILFPVLGHTEMLLQDIPEDNPIHNNLEKIYTGANRAKELVKQILTFSRQEKSELMLIKIQPVIKEALKLIRATIPTTIEMKQDINPDCGVIKADPTQIHQIVMNITTNAYHAMEETGGILKVSLKQIESGEDSLEIPDLEPGAYACLTIADTGAGIDKELTDKIFDPFFTTKEIGKGTGMGLSVVHGIVKNMNGIINVCSEPDKGTEFNVYFPIEKSSYEKQRTQTNEVIPLGTEHVLLVDDEKEILSMEKEMLERLGYKVTSRISSIEALEAFKINPDRIDLVITDMAMPNMAGDKLSVELTKIRPDIPILICTGFSETMSEEKAASLGINGFLLKPIVMKDLSHKIREVLDKK